MQIMYHNDENLLLMALMYIFFTKAGLYSEEIPKLIPEKL
jgi:hypothetical protein